MFLLKDIFQGDLFNVMKPTTVTKTDESNVIRNENNNVLNNNNNALNNNNV